MRHICVAYEEKGPYERVLERAAELSRALGAHVTVTSVAPVPVRFGRGIGPFDPADPPARHEAEVGRAVARLEALGVHDVTGVLLSGEPADEIVALARSRHADLIILGAHEGGFWSRLIERSIDDAVAHKSNVDVLIVH